MTGNIRNRNVRFYEEKEADRRAWEILHSEAVRAFPSQNDFIIQAINDFYDRHLAISDDPYLETREKEDAFADRIMEKVEQKVLGNLSQLIGIYLLQQNILATGNDARAENYLKENGIYTSILTTDTAEDFYRRNGYKKASGCRAKNQDVVFVKRMR